MEKRRKDTDNKILSRQVVLLLIIMTAVSLSACAVPFLGDREEAAPSPAPERVDTGFVVTGPDS